MLLTMAIEALMQLGQREQAAALYPLTKELVESGAMVLLAPGAPLIEKCIGAIAERWDEAESRFETSGGALSAHKGARRKRCDGAAGSRRAAHRKVRGYRCDGR